MSCWFGKTPKTDCKEGPKIVLTRASTPPKKGNEPDPNPSVTRLVPKLVKPPRPVGTRFPAFKVGAITPKSSYFCKNRAFKPVKGQISI